MTREQVTMVLKSNRKMVIDLFNENVKKDDFYTLKWFMTRILERSCLSWARRVNISEKEINSQLKSMLKDYPMIQKGWKSNFQKAVDVYGFKHAYAILNAR